MKKPTNCLKAITMNSNEENYDKNRRGIIAKAIGQMAHMCMIVHVLDNAVEMAQRECDMVEHNDTQDQVSSTIGKRSALQAISVMNYVVDTKFAMMPPEEKLQDAFEPPLSTTAKPINAETSSHIPVSYFAHEKFTDHYGKYVKKVLLHKGTVVKASEVSGRHLIPPATPLPNTTNRYPTVAAEGFLKSMESLGLGDIDRTANGKSILLRKRRLEDMSTEAKNKLRKIKLSDEEYEESME